MTDPTSAQEPKGLRGSRYVRSSRTAATCDDEVSGRWVAVDESGWDGEQLYGRGDRYLVLGTVAIDDVSAASIVQELRCVAGVTQPPELKSAQFTGSRIGNRLAVLADLLKPGGVLADRISVYMLDKHYFVIGKIIDLLLEEHAAEHGLNLHAGGLARELARTLFNEGPRALGWDGFNRLIATMVDFASIRNRGGAQVSVDALFGEIENAWARSSRRRVTTILFRLRETRSVATSFLEALSNHDNPPTMEPLAPSLASLLRIWSAKIGAVSVLVDEQRVFTDELLDNICHIVSVEIGPLGGLVHVPAVRATRTIVRGVSRDHPSVQIADLVAGAGQAVARRHVGVLSPAGEQLWRVVVPLITDRSMVSHDEPGRFAQQGAG